MRYARSVKSPLLPQAIVPNAVTTMLPASPKNFAVSPANGWCKHVKNEMLRIEPPCSTLKGAYGPEAPPRNWRRSLSVSGHDRSRCNRPDLLECLNVARVDRAEDAHRPPCQKALRGLDLLTAED